MTRIHQSLFRAILLSGDLTVPTDQLCWTSGELTSASLLDAETMRKEAGKATEGVAERVEDLGGRLLWLQCVRSKGVVQRDGSQAAHSVCTSAWALPPRVQRTTTVRHLHGPSHLLPGRLGVEGPRLAGTEAKNTEKAQILSTKGNPSPLYFPNPSIHGNWSREESCCALSSPLFGFRLPR